MTQVLRQSTAVDVLIGPFLDVTDGKTAETGETPAVKLSKNGQALAAKSDVTVPLHDADGYHNCELDATDTDTVGTLVLTCVGTATALPVRHEYQVIEEAAYDAIYAASAAPATAAALAVVDGIVDDILVDTAEIGAAGAGLTEAGGTGDHLTALATAANLATVDTVADAIKAKTDSLTFTVAGQVDANVQYVNDVAVTGTGAAGDEWGP